MTILGILMIYLALHVSLVRENQRHYGKFNVVSQTSVFATPYLPHSSRPACAIRDSQTSYQNQWYKTCACC